jgi:dephospho-CoA kinase
MHILGIVGGIASGKSAVSAALDELGAVVLNADSAAHEVLQQEDVKRALVTRWGSEILAGQGQVDRNAVARRIFSTKQGNSTRVETERDRQFLEQTIHPRIRQQFQREIERLARQGEAVAVIDAPLLLEAGWGVACNDILFVDCPAEIRLKRALQRGWTKQQFLEREAAQWPIEEKRRASTVQIDNSGNSRAQLVKSVRRLWDSKWAS